MKSPRINLHGLPLPACARDPETGSEWMQNPAFKGVWGVCLPTERIVEQNPNRLSGPSRICVFRFPVISSKSPPRLSPFFLHLSHTGLSFFFKPAESFPAPKLGHFFPDALPPPCMQWLCHPSGVCSGQALFSPS